MQKRVGLRGEAYGAVPEVLRELREVEAIGPGRGENTAIALGARVFLTEIYDLYDIFFLFFFQII